MATSNEREPLTHDRVIAEALRLADEEGADALSMRHLGQRLGVEAMSLYNHVANKDEILDGIVEAVLSEIVIPSLEDDWKEAMRRRAISAREVFLRHPWAMGVLESRPQNSSPQRLGYYDAVLGALLNAGFDSRLAVRAFSTLDAYIFGSILQELRLAFDDQESLDRIGDDLMRQMAEAYPHLSAATAEAMEAGYDLAAEFLWGLDLMLDAFEAERDGSRVG